MCCCKHVTRVIWLCYCAGYGTCNNSSQCVGLDGTSCAVCREADWSKHLQHLPAHVHHVDQQRHNTAHQQSACFTHLRLHHTVLILHTNTISMPPALQICSSSTARGITAAQCICCVRSFFASVQDPTTRRLNLTSVYKGNVVVSGLLQMFLMVNLIVFAERIVRARRQGKSWSASILPIWASLPHSLLCSCTAHELTFDQHH